MADPRFDLERSRAYWRHLPAGDGKHDTSALGALADTDLLATWDEAFRSRFVNYPEEAQFLLTFGERIRGRRMLSIGSGLGFHEMYYASRGAEIECLDIVKSNVDTVARVAQLKRLGSIRARVCDDVTTSEVGGPFDVAFIYGCLMHMPAAAQRALLARARAALGAGGSIVLMVYAWEFARKACGWTDPAQFDPLVFGRASDPPVGTEACPWSDWHDDLKLLDLAGGDMRIARRQSWNDGLFTWYELMVGPPGPPDAFFLPSAVDRGIHLTSVSLRQLEPVDATLFRVRGCAQVTTGVNRCSYAVISDELAAVPGANAILADVDLEQGGLSIGLLDVDRQQFLATATVTSPGRRRVLLLARGWPNRSQIVLSNHQPDPPQRSVFAIHSVRILKWAPIEPPARSEGG